jgi:signal peptidase II
MPIRTAPRLALLLVILGTVGCDHMTKHIATAELSGRPAQSFLGDTVRLLYTENVGGFLSLGANLPSGVRSAMFTVAVGAFLAAALLVALRMRPAPRHLAALARKGTRRGTR